MSGGYESIAIGDGYEAGSRTITEADVVNFAGVSGDFNALHTDAELMGTTDFGERIAHGALVFSMTTGLLWQARPAEEREHIVAFYGVDNLRFVNPVFIGDTIQPSVEVLDKEPSDHPVATGVVRNEVTVTNQHDETVLAAELLSLLR